MKNKGKSKKGVNKNQQVTIQIGKNIVSVQGSDININQLHNKMMIFDLVKKFLAWSMGIVGATIVAIGFYCLTASGYLKPKDIEKHITPKVFKSIIPILTTFNEKKKPP